eukprot:5231274-Pyramimonas_sp.AAC.1
MMPGYAASREEDRTCNGGTPHGGIGGGGGEWEEEVTDEDPGRDGDDNENPTEEKWRLVGDRDGGDGDDDAADGIDGESADEGDGDGDREKISSMTSMPVLKRMMRMSMGCGGCDDGVGDGDGG